MNRRYFFSSLFCVTVLPISLQAEETKGEPDYFRYAFERLSEFERRSLQVELQMAGLYTANVDGKYGPSTRRAIVSAPNFIKKTSYNKVVIDLKTVGDLETFLKDIAKGEYSIWLYGEGNEGF